MIVIKIELWPLGSEKRAKEIGRMYIANDGQASPGALFKEPSRGNYVVGVCRRGTTACPQPVDPDGPKPTRAGSVKNYPRLAYNVWRLIARALASCFPEETKSSAANLCEALPLDGPAQVEDFEEGHG